MTPNVHELLYHHVTLEGSEVDSTPGAAHVRVMTARWTPTLKQYKP